MNLGKAIKLLLVKRGITQKELADKANLSETSISLLMKGRTKPRKETLELIADVLKVKPEILIFLSIDHEDVPDEKKELYEMVWPQLETTFMKLFIKDEYKL